MNAVSAIGEAKPGGMSGGGGAGAVAAGAGRISARAKIWLLVPTLVNPTVIGVLAVDRALASIAASVSTAEPMPWL